MMENNSRPSLRLATALPETAAGIEGSFLSSAPRPITAPRRTGTRTANFFIAEILPHLGACDEALAGCANEIRGGGLLSGGAHEACDLSTMICPGQH